MAAVVATVPDVDDDDGALLASLARANSPVLDGNAAEHETAALVPTFCFAPPPPLAAAIRNCVAVFTCSRSGCKSVVFRSFKELREHERANHMRYSALLDPLRCPIVGCNLLLPTAREANLHAMQHTIASPFIFRCGTCDAGFALHGHLEEHLRNYRHAP